MGLGESLSIENGTYDIEATLDCRRRERYAIKSVLCFSGEYSAILNNGHNVFVFGSNLAGRHGKGAALIARTQWQAQPGIGVGRTGCCYAIPTKDRDLKVLPLSSIEIHVKEFIEYAKGRPTVNFLVTKLGCGLAGYKEEQIKPFFKDAPENCVLPIGWDEEQRID